MGQIMALKSPATPTLSELSNELDSVKWHELGIKLGLQGHQLREIEQNYPRDSNRCKTEMLDLWLRNSENPSWEAVAKALCLMQECVVANEIQRKYCSSTPTFDQTPVWQSKSSVSASAVPLSYSSSPSSNGSHMKDSSVLAKENLQKIKDKFASLIALAGGVLQGKDIDMSNLRLFLTARYLPEEDDNDTRAIDPSRFNEQVLSSAQCVSEMLQSLMIHRLLSYKNFRVLGSIINHYASDDIEMKTKLDEYEQQLAGYILVTKMKDFLNAELKQSEQTKPDLKLLDELSVKVKASVTEKTLQYVNELWDSLVHQVKLPVTALLFHRVAEGCIEITWLLPSHLTLFTTRRLQESTDYFRKKNILRVTIAGKCVYEEMPPVQEDETNTGRKGDQDDQDAGNLTPLQDDPDVGSLNFPQTIQQVTGDEPEGPEDIPEHKQGLKCGRVICTNYSLLYGHLDPEKLLPKLPEKDLISEKQLKAAKAVHQKFAKNAIIIRVLFWHDRPSHGLLKFCDTLETTPGQEHLGRKLLKDYKQQLPVRIHSSSETTAVHCSLRETSELFQQLQQTVVELLDHFPGALANLKQVLASLVLPVGNGMVIQLVDPLSYENAQTIRELFRLMNPYWNSLSTDLLGLLLEASGCDEAASKVVEFVEARASKGHLVLCIHQLPTFVSDDNDLDMTDLEAVHNAPLSQLQSLHPDVFVRLPEHKVISTRRTVRISVEVNKPLLFITDYEKITTALGGFFQIPKAALVYAGCSEAPLVLCWLAPSFLVFYIEATGCGLLLMSAHRLLAENKVTRIAVGGQTYKCPSIKEVKLWEACQYGLVEQVHYLLLAGVNVNIVDFDGFFALYNASEKGYDSIVEMLLEAGATVDLETKKGETALYTACNEGHLPVVQHLIAAKADVNHQRKTGETPLYIACEEGHLPVVQYLIAAKADVNIPTVDGTTPLWAACQDGHLQVVKYLIEAKADVNYPDKRGLTPLYIACENGHLLVVKELIATKANVNSRTKDGGTPLWIACQNAHLPVVQYLIIAKADVNHPDKSGVTPLFIACQLGHLPVVEELTAAKADVNIRMKNGNTALIVASQNDHLSVVRVLLQEGATVNTSNRLGTALHAAAVGESDDIVELLLKAKINPDLPNRIFQETALMMVARKGSVGIVRKLIQHGASINLTNKDGMTSLYMACQEGNFQVVKCLIAAKADVNHQRKGGGTALYIACQMGRTVIVEQLIAAKANVNHQRKNGATALMVAADFGHSSVVRVLLQAEAATNTTMKSGWTALHFAVDSEHEDIVELLLKAEADPNMSKKPSQETALMMAARKGSVGIVRKLIQHKASVNFTNKKGDTAFDIARAKGHMSVCHELLTQKSS